MINSFFKIIACSSGYLWAPPGTSLIIASIILYLAEGKAQPEAFGSIIRSFWWSTITLTTIGYGDVYPITILGKIATTIIAIAGIGIVALPAGIIAGSFSEIVNKKK